MSKPPRGGLLTGPSVFPGKVLAKKHFFSPSPLIPIPVFLRYLAMAPFLFLENILAKSTCFYLSS